MDNITVGTIYEDPEGIWEVTGVYNYTCIVKQVQEGNLNFGKEFTVDISEVEYYRSLNKNYI